MLKVLQILTQHISPHDRLIVGVSGGPDSTVLLRMLAAYFQSLPLYRSTALLPLVVAHVNHGIRGKESDRDEQFVRDLAKSYKLKCEVKRVKLSGQSGLEERGRNIRRAFFEKLRAKYKAKWILTAHTEDDQLETIIFNFLRGSGPAGLAGMKMIDGFYFKPLLATPKSEILAYLKARKLKYCQDETNQDTRFRRNFIRKKILPLFISVNPSFRRTILRSGIAFGRIEDWIFEEAKQFLAQYKTTYGLFSQKVFLKLPKALQSAIVEEAYQHESGLHYRLPFSKVEEIIQLIIKGIGNKRIECGEGNEFILKKGILYFQRRKSKLTVL